jgi:methylated-DNA-protein-cysteine methyltransferase-like protein
MVGGGLRVADGRARLHESIYAVVRQVPSGRVATYGQIAAILDRCTPRMVGYAMAAVPFGSHVPWHRVINSQGRISTRATGDDCPEQRAMLETEGVRFDERGRVDLEEFGWTGPGVKRHRRGAGRSAGGKGVQRSVDRGDP